MTNWLTPETAIGARLPCGATVVRARWNVPPASVLVDFDRSPLSEDGSKVTSRDRWAFRKDGSACGLFSSLIPPAPPVAQDGVMVTREMLAEAMTKLSFRNVTSAELADALGIPPEPPKVAPWEAAAARLSGWGDDLAAYKAWSKRGPLYDERGTWQAAVEWCVGQIDMHKQISGDDDDIAVLDAIRARIMGETK